MSDDIIPAPRLDKYSASMLWIYLDWEDSETELRVHYAEQDGVKYRASLDESGRLEYVQVMGVAS